MLLDLESIHHNRFHLCHQLEYMYILDLESILHNHDPKDYFLEYMLIDPK